MRVAMIHPSLVLRGGAERQVVELAVGLQKLGHEVEVFTDAIGEECYPNLLKNVTVNVVPHPLRQLQRGLARPITSFLMERELPKENVPRYRNLMEKVIWRQYYTNALPIMLNIGKRIPKCFDIINNHNFPSEWAALIAKKRLRVPIVWMCNEPPSWFFSMDSRSPTSKLYWPLFEIFDKIAVGYIDQIVVLSQVAAGYVKKAYNRSAQIVRTWADVELFHKAKSEDVRKAYGLENSFVLLQVGNFGSNRRNVDSIKTLHYVSNNHDNVKLILDGYGSQEQKNLLVSLAKKLDVEDKILFLHTVNDEETAKVYAACDVFLFPAEITWGLAVIEAMAAARPVVVSKRCGASEVIQNNVNGFVVDHAKPEEMAKRVELLISDSSLRRKLGENAYEYVKNNSSWEKYARNMENIFRQSILAFKPKRNCATVA
jgi:glycosyltransferase involved in cell wall biosynthesis